MVTVTLMFCGDNNSHMSFLSTLSYVYHHSEDMPNQYVLPINNAVDNAVDNATLSAYNTFQDTWTSNNRNIIYNETTGTTISPDNE